ncbi:hypothetical protein CEQ90_00570 [Lewinellaceae bacterium SD302]|nr:hypothetical protein CEQ90_00570 [Lewinellaceae bacterium SD302]
MPLLPNYYTAILLSTLLVFLFPLLASWAYNKPGFPRWLSTIVSCYLVGIIVANFRIWTVPEEGVRQLAEISMLLGLPLLLFAVDIRDSFAYARSMLGSFALCCLAGIICTSLTAIYLSGNVAHPEKIAGMLTGLYTGGTPNVQAIGIALDAPANYLVLIQAADVLLGGAYLLGLISFLPAVYARFFPPTEVVEVKETTEELANNAKKADWLIHAKGIGLGLIVTVISLGICFLFTGGIKNGTLIILTMTTLGLFIGSYRPVASKLNSYPVGEYFILCFCVALGLLADFRALAADGMELLLFSAIALSATTLLHLLLCYWRKIDRDTVILSSVAAFYGPVFVVQVATAIKNKSLMAAGLAVSLLGFGLGNYLGIGVAWLVDFFSQSS